MYLTNRNVHTTHFGTDTIKFRTQLNEANARHKKE